MKHLLIGILFFTSFSVDAQRPGGSPVHPNVLLNQSFWQAKPEVEAVKAEIEKGHNPAELTSSSHDAVTMAINSGAPNSTIKYLIAQKDNTVDKLTHDGRTYIFWAASKGNIEIMEHLIAKGAKTDINDSHGYSVINFAASGGQTDTLVFDLCIKNGANPRAELTHEAANALLLVAGTDKDMRLTEYFISKGLDINSVDAQGNTAANYAARAGNIPMIKALQAKGVKLTDNAIIMAAQGSRRSGPPLEFFQFLESQGLNANAIGKNGENALHSIVRRPEQLETIKYFLSKGVDVNQFNEEGNNVLMNAAASNRDLNTLAFLATLVKNINTVNKNGTSALALAVQGNTAEVIDLLVKNQANINTLDAKGNNLVYYLFESYSPRSPKDFEGKLIALKNLGLKLNAPQKDGNTLFHLAVAKNDIGLLKQIENLGADVNSKNAEGITALHKAAMISKNDGLLKYLLSIGAKKELATGFNETAFQLASENEYLSTQKISVEFLK